MNIELKDKNVQKTTELVINLIKKYNNHCDLSISSFNHEYYNELSKYDIDIQFQFLLDYQLPDNETKDKSHKDIIPIYKNGNKKGTINMFFGEITEEIVKEVHDSGLGIMAWCNKVKNEKLNDAENEEIFFKLISIGVDIICSNYPDKVFNARQKYIESVSVVV